MKHSHKKAKYTVTAIGVIALILLAAVFIDPSGFFNSPSNTVVSISSINVDPQGSPVGDEWRGSFWNLLVAVTANDDIAGVKLNKDQTGSITYQGAIEALKTGASVEVKIDPGQPYLIRDIQEHAANDGMVTPQVGQTYVNRYLPADKGENFDKKANEVTLHWYSWGEATWRVYAPFTVSVYKNGQLVGQPMTFNTQGTSTVQSISTNEGAVRVEGLGSLSGTYTGFSGPTQVCIFKGYGNIYDYTQVQNIIQYNQGAQYQTFGMDNRFSTVTGTSNAYCTYWYGNTAGTSYVWSSNKQPAGIVSYGTSSSNMISTSSYGGWQNGDDGSYFRRNPVTPVIGPNDKNNLPADKRSFYSLTEYIEQQKGIQNLALTTFNTRAAGSSGALWQKASFVTDTNGQTALRLDIPWSAFGTPLVNIRIPTELADTFIDRPIVTSTQVSAKWESTGNKYCDLYGSNRIAVAVTNTGTVTGSSRITATSTNSKLSLTPLEQTVNNLAPNQAQTSYFDATNLGVDTHPNNIPITITAYDTYTGSQTGSDTIYGTLKPTIQTGTTTLKLHVVEKGTNIPIQGLALTVQYGSEAPTPFTNANGDITLTLSTPQGGAYTGQVYVQSADTTVYKTASSTYNIANPTAYEYTFEVERKDTTYPDIDEISWFTILLAIIAAAAIITFVAGLGYYAHKHPGKIKRRRHR